AEADAEPQHVHRRLEEVGQQVDEPGALVEHEAAPPHVQRAAQRDAQQRLCRSAAHSTSLRPASFKNTSSSVARRANSSIPSWRSAMIACTSGSADAVKRSSRSSSDSLASTRSRRRAATASREARGPYTSITSRLLWVRMRSRGLPSAMMRTPSQL